MKQIAACTGLSIEKIQATEALQNDYSLGKLTTQELYKTFQSFSKKRFSFDAFDEAISNIFTPNKEIVPVIEKLKNESLRLVIISNTCESHYRTIASSYPVMDLFDERILSFQVGFLKPDVRIFENALKAAKCAPHECFYTDDISDFIESAKTVGLDGEVFTSVPSLEKQLIQRGCLFLNG